MQRALRGQSDQYVDRGEMGTADVDRFVEESLTVEEDTRPLSKEMVSGQLSCLGVTPNLRHA